MAENLYDRDTYIRFYEKFYHGKINPAHIYEPGTIERRRYTHRLFKTIPGKLLVVGSGMGAIFWGLDSHDCYGVDISMASLTGAMQNNPNVKFARCDATMLPFPSDSFDIVYSNAVLEHIVDDKAAALEMLRVLRPGGLLLQCVPGNPKIPVEENLGHLRHYTEESLLNLFGDDIENCKCIFPQKFYDTFWSPFKRLLWKLETPANVLDLYNFRYYFARYILRRPKEKYMAIPHRKLSFYERFWYRYFIRYLVYIFIRIPDRIVSGKEKYAFSVPYCIYLQANKKKK